MNDLKDRVMEAIQLRWDETRPPGGVGTTDSKEIYEVLVSAGINVPRGAMADILQDLYNEGRISGRGYQDRAGIQVHGAWSIVEP